MRIQHTDVCDTSQLITPKEMAKEIKYLNKHKKCSYQLLMGWGIVITLLIIHWCI